MHALWVLVVAAAVAVGAGRGAGHGEARIAALTGVTREAPAALRTAAVHPALPAITGRSGRSRGARASHPSLPPVALAAGGSLEPRPCAIAAPWLPAEDRRPDRSIWVPRARGPPIA